jgi:hypothetical protein
LPQGWGVGRERAAEVAAKSFLQTARRNGPEAGEPVQDEPKRP